MSAEIRMGWIEHSSGLAITRQCELAQVARATFYGRHPSCEHSEHELLLMRLIDEEYTRRPFYGSRRMVVFLGRQGHIYNKVLGPEPRWRHNGAHESRPQRFAF